MNHHHTKQSPHNLYDTHSYPQATENMKADLHMLESLTDNHRAFRIYNWPSASLTYGYNQRLPDAFQQLEAAKRPTGGGIVFHSPGDMVLSMAYWKNDPAFPKKPTDLGFLSHYLSEVFKATHIHFNTNTKKGPKNTLYCATYENPHERYYKHQKIIGISTRRFREKVLIQCIIHLENGLKSFPKLAHPFISEGVPKQDLRLLQTHITHHIHSLCTKEPFQWAL